MLSCVPTFAIIVFDVKPVCLLHLFERQVHLQRQISSRIVLELRHFRSRSRILRNNQSDNQLDIAQPSAHNTTAAHTIHLSYKRHNQHTQSYIQPANTQSGCTASQHTIRIHIQHTSACISMYNQHAPGTTRLADSSNDAPYFAVVLHTYSSVEQS